METVYGAIKLFLKSCLQSSKEREWRARFLEKMALTNRSDIDSMPGATQSALGLTLTSIARVSIIAHVDSPMSSPSC